MIDPVTLADLESELNAFDLAKRSSAYHKLLDLAAQGVIPLESVSACCNMHCHTFLSFNAYGYSPTSLAWLGKRKGIPLMGIVDFDVLDGVDEFLVASAQAGVKGTAGVETRVFLPEFAGREINSPGEPGIAYHMGIGFTSSQAPGTAASILAGLRQRAENRNRQVVERVNRYLSPVEIDYQEDVLPLTPAGTATERHIVIAYIQAVVLRTPDPARFWAGKLQLPLETISSLIADSARFQTHVRAKLMKRGGVGYIQPAPESFPSVDEFHHLILACGALPCAAWLDGTSEGEQSMPELLETLVGKGVAAINIIPDRNWNILDPVEHDKKVKNLYDTVRLARKMDLPVHVGTEMNSFGQKWVDDFEAPELRLLQAEFMDGAWFTYGHTALQRTIGLGYGSEWAASWLPRRRERNAFYSQLGRMIPPGEAGLNMLRSLPPSINPKDIIKRLSEGEGVYA